MDATQWRPKAEPHMPADWDEDVLWAVRALASGTANEGQQRMAWEWMMYLTGASEQFADLSYRPGPDGMWATAFAEGKRAVGLQLRKMLSPILTPKTPYQHPTPPTPQKRRRAPAKRRTKP